MMQHDFMRLGVRVTIAPGEKERAMAIINELRGCVGEAWRDEDAALLARIGK